jgi:hypothetical protein
MDPRTAESFCGGIRRYCRACECGLSVGALPARSYFGRGRLISRRLASAFEFRGHGVVNFKRNCEILGQAAISFSKIRGDPDLQKRFVAPSPYFSRNPRQAKGFGIPPGSRGATCFTPWPQEVA